MSRPFAPRPGRPCLVLLAWSLLAEARLRPVPDPRSPRVSSASRPPTLDARFSRRASLAGQPCSRGAASPGATPPPRSVSSRGGPAPPGSTRSTFRKPRNGGDRGDNRRGASGYKAASTSAPRPDRSRHPAAWRPCETSPIARPPPRRPQRGASMNGLGLPACVSKPAVIHDYDPYHIRSLLS